MIVVAASAHSGRSRAPVTSRTRYERAFARLTLAEAAGDRYSPALMGTEKRDRQKANKAAKLEAEQAADAKQRRNQTIRTVRHRRGRRSWS